MENPIHLDSQQLRHEHFDLIEKTKLKKELCLKKHENKLK